ncbi:MAG TPA: FAD-binding protein, partial [Firmicutes bacterium]|nr:FAD-binding protein [Bacillota bacterium]
RLQEIEKFEKLIEKPDYETDVLVIGAGGAGCSAALTAMLNGQKVIITTKLRMGDANTVMAEGGIQGATQEVDSPYYHYLDTIGGGHFTNDPKLVKALVTDAPLVIEWLESLGMMFDKEKDGRLKVLKGGGVCRRRMHSSADMTGSEIMRVLRDEVKNNPDKILPIEFAPAVELILDEEGKCMGAILYHLETKVYSVVYAKSVIIATGGFGRLHVQGFPTTNHYGATADGIILAYRAGVRHRFMYSTQYHPTGAVFPEQNIGLLITEKVRTLGAEPVNKHGEEFVFPLEPRDVESACIIRECIERENGIATPTGRLGVWLDSPMIEILRGEGTVKKALEAKYIQFKRYGIDISKEPMLIYPTLHYQNGGIEIDDWGGTTVPGLYAAGEVAGGIHGENRLMGNSLLDINVFGRRAGKKASEYIKSGISLGKPKLDHVKKHHNALKEAGLVTEELSPMFLPDYSNPKVRERQLTAKRFGTLQ